MFPVEKLNKVFAKVLKVIKLLKSVLPSLEKKSKKFFYKLLAMRVLIKLKN